MTTTATNAGGNANDNMKYVLVTGGVMSGIGKGIIASSTGVLLQAAGLRTTAIKIDPYINLDAGTMSPFEHGEVFVLDDGGEADLDLGNYERFLDITLTRDNNITTGKIYNRVIQKERQGLYLGQTVQVVPHIVNEIQDCVARVSRAAIDGSGQQPEVCVIELGGTVGDIESSPFVEAMRQFQFRVGRDNFCCVHVSLVPTLGAVGEQKTKPTQASVRELRGEGLAPDFIVCRSSEPLQAGTKQKIANFCHVDVDHVMACHDVPNIFYVPTLLLEQNFAANLLRRLRIDKPAPVISTTTGAAAIPAPLSPSSSLLSSAASQHDVASWAAVADRFDRLVRDCTAVKAGQPLDDAARQVIRIAVVGKYTSLSDAYLSVIRSLQHASITADVGVLIDWVDASNLEDPVSPGGGGGDAAAAADKAHQEAWEVVRSANGILVPGGFGERGVEGKILAAKYAREQRKPYLGICLGLQVAAIEFCRNVLHLEGANSIEFNRTTPHPAVVFMPEIDPVNMGGTMRLGARKTLVKDARSIMARLYGTTTEINERHRHRYEVNPDLVPDMEAAGLHFVGQDESGKRMEIAELQGHPYFVGVQYHPEFKSRPMRASPPFLGLVLAAAGKLEQHLAQ